MKFETVIIGGGLAGLICGIRLQQNKHSCVIVSTGQSALHFSSGSFDLYSKDKDGKDIVKNVLFHIGNLIQSEPNHPYAKIGIDRVKILTEEATKLFSDAGISLFGDDNNNHYRTTPIGKLVPTWLTQKGYAVGLSNKIESKSKIALFKIDGYLDAFPSFTADEVKKSGADVKQIQLEHPIFDILRISPTGLTATSIARELDKKGNREILIRDIKSKMSDADTLLLPACISMDCSYIVKELIKETGRDVMLIPTLPLSVAGSFMQDCLVEYFRSLGGVYMLGDTIEKAELKENSVDKVFSVNHGNIPFIGKNFVLSSGGFFSKGIISTNLEIKEPLFDLDIDYDKDRYAWYNKDSFKTQEYQSYGAKSTKEFRAIYKGNVIDNLYLAGAILDGYNPIKEGSGGGVSILSALHVADQILKK